MDKGDDKPHHENGVCMHCGGEVDAEGYAHGGEPETAEHEIPPEAGDESVQQAAASRMRKFAVAVKGEK